MKSDKKENDADFAFFSAFGFNNHCVEEALLLRAVVAAFSLQGSGRICRRVWRRRFRGVEEGW
ncbi:hypothetical protein JHK84_028971 [Glycine max]|nr:hypothetical protein JHK87_028634 [Glycine soja]KAG5152499.1 hypothetical protein JHK84_028971 [Glycine max]